MGCGPNRAIRTYNAHNTYSRSDSFERANAAQCIRNSDRRKDAHRFDISFTNLTFQFNMNNKVLMEAVALFCGSDDDDDDLDLFVDSSSSSSSSDEDDERTLAVAAVLGNKRGELQKKPRIENYVERTVARYSAEEFKLHFRMFPETFEFILQLIGPTISTTNSMSGRRPTDAKKQLLLTLWVMATPDSYRSICEKFDVGKATAIRSVRRVSHALQCLASRFIKWPTGERAREVMAEFEKYSAFPRVIGAIDGTHIKTNAPRDDPQLYINRKGCHSIQVQAVCTYNLLFTSVFAGNAGCVHDARVFRLSPVHNYLETPEIFFPDDSHIIGDAAYGIHPNVMVPFKDNGHLNERQNNFNFCLSSARMSIERTFGLWKGRWRSILDCLPMVTLEKIPQYLLATCVLHNICILRGDMFPFDEVLRVNRRGRLIENQRLEGDAKRLRIMNNLIIRNN